MHLWQSGRVTRRRVFVNLLMQYAVVATTFGALAYTYRAGKKGELGRLFMTVHRRLLRH